VDHRAKHVWTRTRPLARRHLEGVVGRRSSVSHSCLCAYRSSAQFIDHEGRNYIQLRYGRHPCCTCALERLRKEKISGWAAGLPQSGNTSEMDLSMSCTWPTPLFFLAPASASWRDGSAGARISRYFTHHHGQGHACVDREEESVSPLLYSKEESLGSGGPASLLEYSGGGGGSSFCRNASSACE
jgi:hypothetical protein